MFVSGKFPWQKGSEASSESVPYHTTTLGTLAVGSIREVYFPKGAANTVVYGWTIEIPYLGKKERRKKKKNYK